MNIESVFALSPPEKLLLVEDLWDDLATDPSNVPVHDWQIQEVNRRRNNLMRNPAAALTWQKLKAQIRA